MTSRPAAEIVTPFPQETVAAFVRRVGPVVTSTVATRFGMDMRDARKALKRLERAGEIESARIIVGGEKWAGPELVWRAPFSGLGDFSLDRPAD